MKRLKLALTLSALAALAAACGESTQTNQTARVASSPAAPAATPPPATPTPDQFADARATYNQTCVRCHKENGEGGLAELDEKKTIKVPSFKAAHALKDSDQDFIRKITNGDDDMPAFGKRLTQEQIQGLVRFIRHEFQAGLKPDGH